MLALPRPRHAALAAALALVCSLGTVGQAPAAPAAPADRSDRSGESFQIAAAPAAKPPAAVGAIRNQPNAKTRVYDSYYGAWATPDVLHSYAAGDGKVGVVMLDRRRRLLQVDTYRTSDAKRAGASRTVKLAKTFPLFGGVWTSPEGFHVLLDGRTNPAEDDDRVVIRVRRFTEAWKPAGVATVNGGVNQGVKGVVEPFSASSAAFVQVGRRLVVHTGRSMYKTGDGVNHQADLTFEVDLDSMKATPFAQRGDAPYSSHSFNQLAATSGGTLALLDHGDAFPRALQLSVFDDFPQQRTIRSYEVLPFDGEVGANETGATVTGLAVGPDGVLVTGTSQPHRQALRGVKGYQPKWQQNAYLVKVNPATGAKKFQWLTKYPVKGRSFALETRLVPLGADRFAVLFSGVEKNRPVMNYRLVTSAGRVLAGAAWRGTYFDAASQPVLVGDRLVWPGSTRVSTTGGASPAFLFGLDVSDPTKPVRLR